MESGIVLDRQRVASGLWPPNWKSITSAFTATWYLVLEALKHQFSCRGKQRAHPDLGRGFGRDAFYHWDFFTQLSQPHALALTNAESSSKFGKIPLCCMQILN